jgi:hypothetical protein
MRRRLAAVALAVAAVLTGSFVVSAPAAAADPISAMTAADCEGGRNGFVDIPDNLRGDFVDVTLPGGLLKVELMQGWVGGGQRGWALLSGPTRAGDMVWMDWTTNGGVTWLQCGPFFAPHSQATKTSAAQRTNGSALWQFRACGMIANVPSSLRCTAWW